MIYGGPSLINTVSLAETYDATISTSTEVVFNTSTRLIQVTALTNAVFCKWGTADVTLSDFDVVVPPGQSYFLTVPYQGNGTLYTAINFIESTTSSAVAMCEY